jgi:hypothetical protein
MRGEFGTISSLLKSVALGKVRCRKLFISRCSSVLRHHLFKYQISYLWAKYHQLWTQLLDMSPKQDARAVWLILGEAWARRPHAPEYRHRALVHPAIEQKLGDLEADSLSFVRGANSLAQ